MTSTDDQILAAPIVFRPYFKRVLWGGSKICRYKGISSDATDIGESWEISALPGQESRVDGGLYADMTLQELSDRFGAQLLGDSVLKRYGGKFPMLIKFIDANDRLSVQVHPDDKMAAERHSSLGKSEMWYIIDAVALSAKADALAQQSGDSQTAFDMGLDYIIENHAGASTLPLMDEIGRYQRYGSDFGNII